MRLACLALLALATSALAAPTAGYDAALALATKDEAALSPDQAAALIVSQGDVGGRALAQCRTDNGGILADLAAFTVVLELDAAGKVVRTWRDGDSPIAACFEKAMQAQTLVAPPRAPFHTFFAMSWED